MPREKSNSPSKNRQDIDDYRKVLLQTEDLNPDKKYENNNYVILFILRLTSHIFVSTIDNIAI